jgi:hypothetical protein
LEITVNKRAVRVRKTSFMQDLLGGVKVLTPKRYVSLMIS